MIYWKDGFYTLPISGGVEITDEQHQQLLTEQSEGKSIVTGDGGFPISISNKEDNKSEISMQIANKKRELTNEDYRVIKCYEYSLVGEPLPYDIGSLHAKREKLREEITLLQEGLIV